MRATGARLLVAAALLGTTGAAWAQATDPVVPDAAAGAAEGTAPEDQLEVVCVVSGYDVVLRNEGTVPIPTDTVVAWEVPFARMNGSHLLSSPLDPGGQQFQTAVLGSSYLGPDTPCHAEVSTEDSGNESQTKPDGEAAPAPRSQ